MIPSLIMRGKLYFISFVILTAGKDLILEE